MEEIIERIKNNRIAQIALGAVIFVIIFSFYVLGKISKPKKQTLPCYNITLRILSPFSDQKFTNIQKIFSAYCIKVETIKKPVEYIRENLLKEIAAGNIPDLVYVDNNFIKENKNIFKEYSGEKIKKEKYPEESLVLSDRLLNYPVSFDTLVMFSNEEFLDILGIINPPRTFEELIKTIQGIKVNPFLKNIIPVALGRSNNIENFYEIFITIHRNLHGKGYKNLNNFSKTVEFYTQFADKTSNLYSWDYGNSNSLEEFGRGKVVFAFGFYSDTEKIKEINRRLKFRITEFPKFSGRLDQTNYLKIYSFAVPKQGKHKFAWKALEILDENYKDFIRDFNLLPIRKDVFDELSGEKREIAKDLLIGSDFTEFNRNYAEGIFKDIVDKWLEDRENARLILTRLQFNKIFIK